MYFNVLGHSQDLKMLAELSQSLIYIFDNEITNGRWDVKKILT